MKMKKILSVLLALTMVLGIVPLAVSAEAVSEVYIGNTLLTDGEYLAVGSAEPTTEEPLDCGYAYFKDGVLTLNNFTYAGEGYEYASNDYSVSVDNPRILYFTAAIYADGDLEVVLAGENSLENTDEYLEVVDNIEYYTYAYGIYAVDDLIINGEGSLYVSVEETCLSSGGVISIDCTALELNAGYSGIYCNGGTINCDDFYIYSGGDGIGMGGTDSVLAFTGGNVEIEADYGIYAFDENLTVQIDNANVSISSYYCGIDTSKVIVNSGELYAYAENDVAIEGELSLGEGINIKKGAIFQNEILIGAGPAYGDINADGAVDMFDYLTVKSIYFKKYDATPEELERADLVEDGSIDVFDYLAVKSYYFEMLAKANRQKAYDAIVEHIQTTGEYDAENGYYNIYIEIGDGNSYVLTTDDAGETIDFGAVSQTETEAFAVVGMLADYTTEINVMGMYQGPDAQNIGLGVLDAKTFDGENPAFDNFQMMGGVEDPEMESATLAFFCYGLYYSNEYLAENASADFTDLGIDIPVPAAD